MNKLLLITGLVAITSTGNALENLPGATPFLPVKAVTINAPRLLTNNTSIDQTNLSLKQAIFLALKHNTDLLTSLNNRQLQRFDLLTAKQAFEPQFTLSNTLTYAKTKTSGTEESVSRSLNMAPTMTWTLPLGTKIESSLTFAPTLQQGSSDYTSYDSGYSITVTQPLLQNFGTKVNEVALDNAYDQQTIDDLNLRKKIQSTIQTITNDYYAVVAAKQTYTSSKSNLEQSKKQYQSRKARLKAGQIPSTDVTQARINLFGIEQSMQSAAQALQTAKAKLLDDLGLPANTLFHVDNHIYVNQLKVNIPSSVKNALSNNIDLKIEQLTEKQDERNILTSKNKRLWSLNLVMSNSRSRTNTNYTDINTNDTNQMQNNTSVALNLSIPLDRVSLDKDELSSAISLENQKYARQQQHRTIVNSIVASVQNLNRAWSQYLVSKDKLTLSEQTEKAAQIKYNYGKIDAFTMQQQEQSLISAQNDLINQRIAYLKQVMSYRALEGTLIDHWHINVEARTT